MHDYVEGWDEVEAIIDVPMTQPVGGKFREAWERSGMRRIDVANALAREINYKRDAASLLPSIDDYLSGKRPPRRNRAEALDKILRAGGALLEDWGYRAIQRDDWNALISEARERAAEADHQRREDIEELRRTMDAVNATLEELDRRFRALERRSAPPSAESQ